MLITATEHPVYFVATSGQDDITKNMADTYVQSFEEHQSVSLDEYKALRLGVWKIILKNLLSNLTKINLRGKPFCVLVFIYVLSKRQMESYKNLVIHIL